jgi:hypothetical protein
MERCRVDVRPRLLRQACTAVVAVAVVAVALGGTSPAAADVGVAIEPGELTVDDSVRAGGQVTLPALHLHNPGDDETTYVVRATGLDGTSAIPADGAWFSVEPAEVRLAAGEAADVVPTIQPDDGVAAGRYAAVVRAEIVPDGDGTRIGAAAGVRVFFDVATDETDGGLAHAWIVAVVVLALVLLARRSGLRIRLERVSGARGTSTGPGASGP